MKILKKLLNTLGPGFITGAADDDPSGIATYSQTGAQFGLLQLWACTFTFPLMAAIQVMCGRIALVTGMGLAQNLRTHYPRWVLYISVGIITLVNTVNIGANLAAMAAATQLLLPINFWLLLISFTTISIALEIFLSYQTYAQYLKFLALSLFSYIITALIINVNWIEVLKRTMIPHIRFDKDYVLNILAFFGTTISPYLFFWQSNQEIEERKNNRKNNNAAELPIELKQSYRQTVMGMLFSNTIAWFIIITTGTVLFTNGIRSINSAADAAAALKPLAGNAAFLLFALGIIGTGLLSIPILAASAAYALAQSCEKEATLDAKFKEAPHFYYYIIAITVGGMLVNLIDINPMKLLYYAAALNGIGGPPLIFIILHLANNKKVMGQYSNSMISNLLGYLTAIIMVIAMIAFLFYL